MSNNQMPQSNNGSSNLVEVLEKVLDKGVVIAGDIRVGIADVELLSIKIRLIVASVDKAKEIGLDWWETDPYLTSKATEFNNEKIGQNWEKEKENLQNQIKSLENKLESQQFNTSSSNNEKSDNTIVNKEEILEDTKVDSEKKNIKTQNEAPDFKVDNKDIGDDNSDDKE